MIRRLLMTCGFLLCVIGIFGLLSGQENTPDSINTKITETAIPKVKVWVARRPLQQGEAVTMADIKVKMVAESSVVKREISETEPQTESFTLKPGSLAAVDISTGDRVSEKSFLAPGQPGYIELLIAPGMVPYPLDLDGTTDYNAVLTPGDQVDVVMIASLEQNLANKATLDSYRGLTVGPLLQGCRLLAVEGGIAAENEVAKTTVILELSRKDISKLMIARRVALLDVHKSSTLPLPEVKAGDVLPDFYSVTELRGSERVVN